ncbi:transcription elongation factor SPT5 [Pancytospora epiphaga]|nr:transcription elongation factor SPT5 [Pancytospora epiphaga]
MARHAPKYVHIEAESDDEYNESGGVSEDIDNLAVVHPRAKSYSEFAKEMEEKYLVSGSDDDEDYIDEDTPVLEVPGQAHLLPTARSPLLFLIRCKMGKEKEIAERILENARSYAARGEENGVYSVVHKDGLKGYLYIEAHKKQAVEDVISRVRNVARNRLSIVPFGEMVEALSQREAAVVGDFARVKGGKYNGDIVQVLESYEAVVKIRAVPRIDGVRKLFNPEEHRTAIEKDGGYVFNRDFYQEGYMIKVVLKGSLDFEAEPTFDDLKILGLTAPVCLNDTVKVVKGDLQSMTGKIISISGNSATIIDDSKRSYEINVNELEKYYSPGEMVSHNGTNGVVLGMEDGLVVVGMNNFTEEVKVLASTLRAPIAERREVSGPAVAPRMRRNPLANKKVRIIEGEFKGHTGVVKDVYKDSSRVQLNSNLRFITVPSVYLSYDISKRAELADSYSFGSLPGIKTPGYQTPGYKTPGYQTPGYKTPGYKTPGYQTPGYQTPGYKTPGYQTPGYKTPGYQTPGYKTPGYRGNIGAEGESNWAHHSTQTYDGVLVSADGEVIKVSDYKNGCFISEKGKKYQRTEVSFIMPEKYDNVMILEGVHTGTEGALISIKGDSGIVKTADGASYQVKISELSKKGGDYL